MARYRRTRVAKPYIPAEVNVGSMVRAKLNSSGKSLKEFGKAIGKRSDVVSNLLSNQSWDTKDLELARKFFGENFFIAWFPEVKSFATEKESMEKELKECKEALAEHEHKLRDLKLAFSERENYLLRQINDLHQELKGR